MSTWHDKVLSIYECLEGEQPPRLGRAWEQLAGDIYLANHDQPLWFWAETKSVPLLEFWRDFDPSTQFILVHTAPDAALADAIAQGADSLAALQECLADWYARSQAMLRFHLRTAERSLLIDSQASSTPTTYLQNMADSRQWPLDPQGVEGNPAPESSPTTHYLIQRLLQSAPHILALHNEIAACLFQPDSPAGTDTPCSLDHALLAHLQNRAELHASVKSNRELREELAHRQDALERNTHENRQLLAQLQQNQADLEQRTLVSQRLQATLEQSENARQELQQQLGNLQRSQEDSARENERLLALLQQSEEALEQLRLATVQLQNAVDTGEAEIHALQQQMGNLQGDLEDSAQENAQLLQQLHLTQEELEQWILGTEQLKSELQASEAAQQRQQEQLTTQRQQLDAAVQENRHLNAQLGQSQLRLKEQALRSLEQEKASEATVHSLRAQLAELQQQLAAKAQENQQLSAQQAQARQHIAEQAQHLHEQVAQLESSNASLGVRAQAAEDESEQLLRQLHDTQEELEQYLLRLDRLQARYPDHCCESFSVNLLSARNGSQISQWQFTDIELAGRHIPQLRFRIHLDNGQAGLVIQRSAGNDSPAPLLRWPNAFAMAEELPCMPSNGSVIQGNNLALTGLASSDWQFLQALVAQLIRLLAEDNERRIPMLLDRQALRQGLLALENTLASWPEVLRYDQLELLNDAPRPDYACLHVRLANLQLGNLQWEEVDYRLASRDRPEEAFGQNPRLEFPASSRASLENWFAESSDERGALIELRFAQPDAMDLDVWNTLSEKDRILIACLLSTLPLQIIEFEQRSPAPQHSWQEWQVLSESVTHMLARNVATRSEQPEPQEAGA